MTDARVGILDVEVVSVRDTTSDARVGGVAVESVSGTAPPSATNCRVGVLVVEVAVRAVHATANLTSIHRAVVIPSPVITTVVSVTDGPTPSFIPLV